MTSRIVGYENPFRFDEKEYGHFRVAKLQLPEIEQFVKDWYHVRIENEREREANVKDLIRIFNDKDYVAIRECKSRLSSRQDCGLKYDIKC